MGLFDEGFMRSYTPWVDKKPKKDKERASSLHYKGWTLVDLPNGRYAIDDRSGRRRKVCGLHTEHSDAIAAFRETVDKETS